METVTKHSKIKEPLKSMCVLLQFDLIVDMNNTPSRTIITTVFP